MPENDPFDTAKDQRDYLSELVGEGKKFATPEDLAKGKWHSDAHIAQLEAKLATLEAQNANGMNAEKLLEEVRKLGKPSDPTGQPGEKVETNPPPQTNIEELVLETLSKTEKQRLTTLNREATIVKMNEVWGADTPKKLKEAADELGVSVDYLRDQAQSNPNAFYRLVGIDAAKGIPSGTTVPTGTVRANGNVSTVKNWAYYQEMKRSNPKLYKEQKTQVEIQREAMKLGEAFFA